MAVLVTCMFVALIWELADRDLLLLHYLLLFCYFETHLETGTD